MITSSQRQILEALRERLPGDTCICGEYGVSECDAVWHFRNDVIDLINEFLEKEYLNFPTPSSMPLKPNLSLRRKQVSKLRNWLDEKTASLKVGAPVKIANDGKPIEELVIRYKDYFFMIDLDSETGEPTGSFGWSDSPMTPTPIREFWVAKRGEQ